MLVAMSARIGRRGHFALGGVTLAVSLWAAAPWVFCSETWARETPTTECTMTPVVNAKPRSPLDSAPPLAPHFL
jgi:hypothetical protein